MLIGSPRRVDAISWSKPVRGDSGQTARSRNRMRWQFASLPWELLGARLVMLSLTYPGEWRRWVSDGRVLEAHRKAFLERWRRRFGAPMGVWVKEFQQSGRPHLHVYVAVPDVVPETEYEGLRQRTLLRHRLEWQYGRYDGRAKLPAIGQKYGGDFAMWLRDAWSEVVGTQGVVAKHHARGVDVAVAFWNDEVARTKDRVEVAAYLAGESAKWAQKAPPENFAHVGRYFGHMGGALGFKPKERDIVVDDAVAYELERRLERLVRWRIVAKRRRYGRTGPITFDRRRRGNGVLAFGVRPEDVPKLLARCERAVARKARRGEVRVAWGPTWRGLGPEVLAQQGGEDAHEWQRIHDDRFSYPRPCGCEPNEVCEECAPPIVLRRWAAGCDCRGTEVCALCVDPKLIDDACA